MKILEYNAKYYEVESSLTRGVQLLREIKDPRESVPSEKLANLPTGVEFPNHLKDKIRYNATKQLLSYTGVMTEEETEELLRLSKKRQYAEAIIALFQKSHACYIGVVAERYIGSYAPDKIVSSYEVPVRLIPDLNREKIEYLDLKILSEGRAYPWLVYWNLDGEGMFSRMEWKAEQWLFKDKVYFIYNKKEDYDEKKQLY